MNCCTPGFMPGLEAAYSSSSCIPLAKAQSHSPSLMAREVRQCVVSGCQGKKTSSICSQSPSQRCFLQSIKLLNFKCAKSARVRKKKGKCKTRTLLLWYNQSFHWAPYPQEADQIREVNQAKTKKLLSLQSAWKTQLQELVYPRSMPRHEVTLQH